MEKTLPLLKALLVVAATLLPALAHAAGLGKLTVRSALGEPLLAEIELVNAQKEELITLNARLASRDAFAQARLEYLPIFSNFKFSIELRRDAVPYVKLTSTEPVGEPFVDMLVELTWSSGRLLREYTFLLDPPGTVAPAPAIETAPAPPVAAPMPAPKAPEPGRAPAVAAPEAAPAPKAPSAARPAGEGWAVKRGDTLSKVALANRQPGVSLSQMLVALFRANPDAFMGKNMNRLKTGPILRIPDAKEIETVPPRDAAIEVRAQASEWNEYRQKVAAAPVSVPSPEARPEAAGKVTTKVSEAAPAAGKPEEVLKLSKGEPPAGAQDKRSLQARVQTLQEEAAAKDKALNEANERVAQLEKNIKDMQKLLELKGAPVPAKPEAAKPEAPKPAEAPKTAEAPKMAEAPAPADAPKAVEAPKEAPAEAQKPAEAPKPPAPPKPKAPPPEPSFFEGPTGAALGGLLVILLGAVGLLAYRRRKSEVTPATAAAAAEPVMDAGEAKAATAPAAEEVDSLAEAEVYLAYGRDAQAEEILKDALTRQPGRVEVHNKLLEVYSKRGDKTAFEQTARRLQSLGVTGAAWERVQAMGAAMDAGNPLYGGTPAAAPEAPAPAPTTPGVEVEFEATPVPAAEKPEAVALDFDFDTLIESTPTAAPAAEANPAEHGELVFDITAPEPEQTYQMPGRVDLPLGAEGERPKSLDLSLPSIELDVLESGATPLPVRDARWQEVATKFDLAKVYKEMGDKDGAREILQEVIREGDAGQQEEAKALLASL